MVGVTLMRIVKDPCLIDLDPNPSPRASRRRAHNIMSIREKIHQILLFLPEEDGGCICLSSPRNNFI